jgi:hypothetical protein
MHDEILLESLPFCLCKHILSIILEAQDENNTGLPFGCLFTQIILQPGIDVAEEPKIIQDPLSKQTLMKSNAQLGMRIRMMLHRPLLFML